MGYIYPTMFSLSDAGRQIELRRKALSLTKSGLAAKAGVERRTIYSLENGSLAELGFTKVGKILAVLGLELTLGEANQGRPTLEDLRAEDEGDE